MSSIQQYPFRPSALAKQSVLETTRQAYPFREKAPSVTISTSTTEPRLIEDKEDVIDLTLTIAVLGAICVGFIFMVELMYPGWSVGLLEVIRG